MTNVLIDTNILVYAYDRSEPDKQRQAILVLEKLQWLKTGYVSVQCLAEFFRVVTRGKRPMLPVDEAAQQLEALTLSWPVFNLAPMVVIEAARGVRDFKLSYYDAQLWATARLNQIPVIFSEDFASNTTLEAVSFINPFAPSFALSHWV